MLRATARPRGPVVPPMAQQLQTGAGGGGGHRLASEVGAGARRQSEQGPWFCLH